MKFLGIDIGSTCAKTVIMNEEGLVTDSFIIPTGWSSFDAADRIKERLGEMGLAQNGDYRCVATGYGRAAVPFADKMVTEITCHARGADMLFSGGSMNVIDIGGQDTKVISITDGRVDEFFMNDKCSAGTGKFIEIMAGRLQVPIDELDSLAAQRTEELKISSMCTVFAESEVISLAGRGVSRENIAWGVLNSVALKVSTEYGRLRDQDRGICLTGGLCGMEYFRGMLSERIGRDIRSSEQARYAGAIGAAAIAKERYA